MTVHEVKLYFAYTSPYSYLAMQPAYGLELSYNVRVRFIPFGVDIIIEWVMRKLDAMGLRR